MADTTALKNRIRAAIKANDNQEITGPVLQQTLLDIVDELDLNPELENEATTRGNADTQLNNLITGVKNNVDNGYVYAGIATPSTIPASGKVFYIALQAGTYTNFGSQVLTQGINILRYNGSAWSNQQVIGIDDEPTVDSNNLVKSGGVKELFDSQYGETTADFALADPDGYEIARFARGHIKTKNFDSEVSIENYIAVENDELVDFSLKDENGVSLAQLKTGHIKTKHFYSKDALERIARLEYNQNPNTIYCAGDSITQGQDGIVSPTDDTRQVNRYPDKLKVMVGDAFEVVNLGVGGQEPNEIFARMGWLDLLTDEDFTLPADTSLIAAPSFIGSNDAIDANYLMQQGTTEAREQMSRCWMNGVECALSFSNSTLYINRVTAASKSTFFPSGTNVTFSGEKGLGIYLLYVGQNGTQKDDANLFLGEVKAATSRISGKFLVLGLFTSVAANKTKFDACNALLQKEFGSRYVDPQYICSQQAFDDLGYTPTEDSDITQERYEHGVRSDVHQMENDLLPSSFWRYSWTSNYQYIDDIHLNSIGYTAMARMFYNKMKALKWV